MPFEIDSEEELIKIDVSWERDNFIGKAFDLFLKVYLFRILSTIEKEEGSLQILYDIPISFGCDIGDKFSEILSEYNSIKTQAEKFYSKPFQEIYHLELFPFQKLAPNDVDFISDLKLKLHGGIEKEELSDWLNNSYPNFYQNPEPFVISLILGTSSAKRNFQAISNHVYMFEFAGVKRKDLCEFSSKNINQILNLNQTMSLDNKSLNPVLLFAGGLGDICRLEPDPVAKFKAN